MIEYAVHFEDDPEHDHVRESHRDAHVAFLERLGPRVLVAGMLSREGAERTVGGLWLVRAGSELEVREIVESDPYFVHGLRRTVRIWRYAPAVGAR